MHDIIISKIDLFIDRLIKQFWIRLIVVFWSINIDIFNYIPMY